MNELEQYIKMMVDADVKKMIISNPTRGTNEFKKLVVEVKSGAKYQISKYTKTQVFHENLSKKISHPDVMSLQRGFSSRSTECLILKSI